MTSRDFCYWLQGFFEIHGAAALNAEQAAVVARHLALVFHHEIDPSFGPPAKQHDLNQIHDCVEQSFPGKPPGSDPLPNAWQGVYPPDMRYRC